MWACRIITIGTLILDARYGLTHFGVIERASGTPDERERSLLENLAVMVGNRRPLLVTYNGRGFDLPVIALRSLCHAVPQGWYYRDRDVRSRYAGTGHVDICDWLADHGAVRAGKLDQVARLIGLPGKVGIDGSQVEGLFNDGQLAAIDTYCLADVAQTALLFLRFRLLQGAIAPDDYRDRVAALVDRLAADGRVDEVTSGIDRARLIA